MKVYFFFFFFQATGDVLKRAKLAGDLLIYGRPLRVAPSLT